MNQTSGKNTAGIDTGSNVNNVRRVNLSDQIFSILKDKISRGEWKPGDRIPPESELATSFGVSRMTVRTALQKLATIGLVESKTGDGTFVKNFQINDVIGDLSAFLCSKQNMEDLNVFRTFFEKDCMAIACAIRTERDIKDVKALQLEMVDAAEKDDLKAFNDADLRFHERIIDMTDNAVFKLVGSILHELLNAHLKESTNFYADLQNEDEPQSRREVLLKLCKMHEDYVKALENRDPGMIMNAVDSYMKRYNVMR